MEQDERDYGNYCIHGTNIGTPSGADYLCGYCEMGADYPIPHPEFRCVMTGISVDEFGNRPHSYTDRWTTLEEARKSAAMWLSLPLGPGAKIVARIEERTRTVWVPREELTPEQLAHFEEQREFTEAMDEQHAAYNSMG